MAIGAKTQRIEICGGIASGKTTLAAALSEAGIEGSFENFTANPFWKAFNASPAKYAFETEVVFLLQHYHEIKNAVVVGRVFACDFALSLDLAYAKTTLRGSRLRAFEELHREVLQEVGSPELLVYLRCDARVELERIRARARMEEQKLTIDYLALLNEELERHLTTLGRGANLLVINSKVQNFASDGKARTDVVESIGRSLTSVP